MNHKDDFRNFIATEEPFIPWLDINGPQLESFLVHACLTIFVAYVSRSPRSLLSKIMLILAAFLILNYKVWIDIRQIRADANSSNHSTIVLAARMSYSLIGSLIVYRLYRLWSGRKLETNAIPDSAILYLGTLVIGSFFS